MESFSRVELMNCLSEDHLDEIEELESISEEALSHSELLMYLTEQINKEDYETEPASPYLLDLKECLPEDMLTLLDSIGLSQDRPITAADSQEFLKLKLKEMKYMLTSDQLHSIGMRSDPEPGYLPRGPWDVSLQSNTLPEPEPAPEPDNRTVINLPFSFNSELEEFDVNRGDIFGVAEPIQLVFAVPVTEPEPELTPAEVD